MNDYGHVDDETPSFAISLLPEYRGQGNGTRLMREMLALLKEQQEAVEPIPYHRSDGTIFKYECRKCRTKIFKMDLFCRHCGRPVKWDE